MRSAACSWSSTRLTAAASTAPGASPCANAFAASSISSCRRRRPKTTSCCRLTTAHSFDLDEVARYLHSASVRQLLIQALLDAPMFMTRWRWVAGVALSLPRFRGGKKVPPPLAAHGCRGPLGGGLPRPDRLRRKPRRRPRDPRSPAGPARRLPIASTRRWTRRAGASAARHRSRRYPDRRARSDRAVAARPRSAVGAALRLSRRRAARGAPHSGGDGARWLSPEEADELGRLDAEAIERVRRRPGPTRPMPTSCTMRSTGSALSPRTRSQAEAGEAGSRLAAPRFSPRKRRPASTAAGSRFAGTKSMRHGTVDHSRAAAVVPALWPKPSPDPPIVTPAAYANGMDARRSAGRDPARPSRRAGAGQQAALAGALGLEGR